MRRRPRGRASKPSLRYGNRTVGTGEFCKTDSWFAAFGSPLTFARRAARQQLELLRRLYNSGGDEECVGGDDVPQLSC